MDTMNNIIMKYTRKFNVDGFRHLCNTKNKLVFRVAEDGLLELLFNKQVLWRKSLKEIDVNTLWYQVDWFTAFGEEIGTEDLECKILYLIDRITKCYNLSKDAKYHIIDENFMSALIVEEYGDMVYKVPRTLVYGLLRQNRIIGKVNRDKYGLIKKRTYRQLIPLLIRDRRTNLTIDWGHELIDTIPKYPEHTGQKLFRYLAIEKFQKSYKEKTLARITSEVIVHSKFTSFEFEKNYIILNAKLGTTPKEVLAEPENLRKMVNGALNYYCNKMGLDLNKTVTGNLQYVKESHILVVPITTKMKEKREPHIINPLWED